MDYDVDAVAELLSMALTPVSATMSMLLGTSVHITMPEVARLKRRSPEGIVPCPAVGAGVSMSRDGISCRQLFLMDEQLVSLIANTIMGNSLNDRPVVLDEITLSTVREVMNQCIHSAEETCSEFLGKKLELSLMGIGAIHSYTELKNRMEALDPDGCMVMKSRIKVDGIYDGDIYGLLSDQLFHVVGLDRESKELSPLLPENRRLKTIALKSIRFPELKVTQEDYAVDTIDESRASIMDVAMDVSVEIGSAVCTVRDILNLEEGRVIVLNKQAGAPVNLVVNGQHIGKGDMLVLEDHFAARITEIVDKKEFT